MTREEWLMAATEELRPVFREAGYDLPPTVRASIGWPSRGATSATGRIGECWLTVAVEDKVHEIFISPRLSDPIKILGVLVHELVHTLFGPEEVHGARFRKAALAVGLQGRMPATTEGEALVETLRGIISRIGDYPGSHIKVSQRMAKADKCRLVKAECPGCGYIIRTTRRWIDEVGLPICPCGDGFQESER